MMPIPSGVKVHLALGVTDMRKGMDGLAMLAQIPPRSTRIVLFKWSKRPDELRDRIERAIGPLKIKRAIATCYHKLTNSILGMPNLAIVRMWLKSVHTV